MRKIDDRANAAELTSDDPHVPRGILMMERDTGKMKLGPGDWTELPYWPPASNGVTEYKRLKSAFSTSSTSLVDVTGMNFSVVADGIYVFEYYLWHFAAATTTGVEFSIDVPASPTSVLFANVHPLTASTVQFFAGDATDEVDSVATSVATGTPGALATVTGFLDNGTTAGDIQLRVSAEVAASITVMAGSWGRATRIA